MTAEDKISPKQISTAHRAASEDPMTTHLLKAWLNVRDAAKGGGGIPR